MKSARAALLWSSFLLFSGCRITPREEAVTIYRDDFGIPNVFADTEDGACYGVGYAQAEDRLEELLKQYRRACGTMSEVFGPSFLRDDYRQRVWRHAAISREKYAEVSLRTRRMLEAFIEGIKTYMRRHPEKVPPWAEEPEPWMVVALGRYVIWGWPEGDAGSDLERAGIKPDPVEPRASNEWAVSGKRTASGAPIALIDPHLSWYGPFRFYESRLYGGDLQVAGVSVVGAPIPSLGHSRYASVAMTTGGPDAADVYEITLDPDHPGKYFYDGQWKDLTTSTEVIRVKNGDTVEEVTKKIEYTHHGPIVAHRDGKGYAMKLPYFGEVGLSEQIYAMMTSRNLAEMKAALGRLQLMEQNIMVSTVQGDIFYLRNGRVPIRPPGYDWSRPVPGNTSRTEWLGIHPLSDLVQITNPPQGYMQNCNVSPAVMMVGSPLKPEVYAKRPYLFNEEQPYLHQRAAQVRSELHADDRLTLERAIEIAHSTAIYNANLWQHFLEEAARAAGAQEKLGEDARRLLRLILDWNRRSDPDSKGAVAYFYWKEAVYSFPEEVGPELEIRGEKRLGEVARLRDRTGLEPPPFPGPKLLDALESGAKQLRGDWGELEVPYGRVFRIGRAGSPRTFPVGGGSLSGMSAPRAVGFKKLDDGKSWIGASGQTATQVVLLTDPPQSFSLLPLGESDDPSSPHFDDQAEKLMQFRRLKPTYFLKKEGPDGLLQHATSTEVLYRGRK